MANTDELKLELAELDHAMKIREQQGEIMRLEIERSRTERAAIEAQTARTREETRHESRQHALEMALHQVNCLDVPTAARVFADQITHNAAGEVVFVGENGKHYPLAEGLVEAMPDYWKPAKLTGGSGTSGLAVRSIRPHNAELSRERAKLSQLKQQFHRSGGAISVMNQLTKQLTTVHVLEELEQRRRNR